MVVTIVNGASETLISRGIIPIRWAVERTGRAIARSTPNNRTTRAKTPRNTTINTCRALIHPEGRSKKIWGYSTREVARKTRRIPFAYFDSDLKLLFSWKNLVVMFQLTCFLGFKAKVCLSNKEVKTSLTWPQFNNNELIIFLFIRYFKINSEIYLWL